MPIYSVPLPDEQILRKISDAKRILIVGCGACANISCNIYQNRVEPAFNILLKPISMIKEIERIKTLLTDKNYKVDSVIVMGLCTDSNRKRKKILKKLNSSDNIIVLSCIGGKSTILNMIHDKRIIHGMQVKGFKSIRLKRVGINIYIDSINEE